MKICSKCGVEKKDSAFGVDNRYGKLRHWCKECDKQYLKEYYLKVIKPVKHPDKEKIIVKLGYRFCLKCETEKLLSGFYPNGGNTCKVCANKRQRERQKINRVHVTKKQKEYRKKIGRKVLNKKQQEWRRKKREHCNLWARKTRSRLVDSYIAANILRPKGIPATKQNIEIARANILIKKIKKALENAGIKICSICNQKKDISEFGNCSFWWKGVKKYRKKNVCKKCDNERLKKYKNKK